MSILPDRDHQRQARPRCAVAGCPEPTTGIYCQGHQAVDREEGSSIRLRCTRAEQCDFHRDGGPAEQRCPGICDADGCSLDGYYEVGADRLMCAAHAGITLLARAVSEALAADNAESA